MKLDSSTPPPLICASGHLRGRANAPMCLCGFVSALPSSGFEVVCELDGGDGAGAGALELDGPDFEVDDAGGFVVGGAGLFGPPGAVFIPAGGWCDDEVGASVDGDA